VFNFKKNPAKSKGPVLAGPKRCGILIGQRSLQVFSATMEEAISGSATAKEYPISEGKYATALKILLEKGEIGHNVAVGLDPTLDFLSTARLDDAAQIQAQTQLAERLSGRLPGGVVMRENPTGKGKVKLKSQVFFPRRIGTSILEGLAKLSRSNVQIQSTAHAVYAYCRKAKVTPRKWKAEIRIVIGEPESMALLIFRGVVVARQAVLTQGDLEKKVAALRPIIQRLIANARTELKLGDLGGVIFHCEPADMPMLQTCCQGIGAPNLQAPPIPLSRSFMAAILCHSKRRGNSAPLGLDSELRFDNERPQFPIKAALPAAASLLGVAFWLWSEGSSLLDEIEQMEASVEELTIEREITPLDIIDVRDQFTVEVGVAEAFLVNRVYWAEIAGDIPKIFPEKMTLVTLEGSYPFHFVPTMLDAEETEEGGEVTDTGPNLKNMYLELLSTVPMVANKVPPENPQLVAGLRNTPSISGPFPNADEPRMHAVQNGDGSEINVTIRCRPPGG
jgi:hypothetical protein